MKTNTFLFLAAVLGLVIFSFVLLNHNKPAAAATLPNKAENVKVGNISEDTWVPIVSAEDGSFTLLVNAANITFNSKDRVVSFTDNFIIKDKGNMVSHKSTDCSSFATLTTDYTIFDTQGTVTTTKTFDPPRLSTAEQTKGSLQDYENHVMCSLVSGGLSK